MQRSKAVSSFLSALASYSFRGSIFTPAASSAESSPVLHSFNTAIPLNPDAVFEPASSEEVATVVRLAQENKIPVYIHSTGHGACIPVDSGLTISTKNLKGVTVDPSSKTAIIKGGERWESVLAEAVKYGLAPIAGTSTDVGVAGLVTGGGFGPFARTYGPASNYVEEFTVVTGEGKTVKANATEHPNLFWALRGGKYGLGVVTEMKVRLLPLQAIYGGSLYYDGAENIEKALRGWAEWTKTASPRITTSATIAYFPPLEHFPPFLRGRRLLVITLAVPGAKEEAEILTEPLTKLASIYKSTVKELKPQEVDQIYDDPKNPGPAWVDSGLLKVVNQDTLTSILDMFGPERKTQFSLIEIRHLGGRAYEAESAISGQSAPYSYSVLGKRPELFQTALPSAMEELRNKLAPWEQPGRNINFVARPLSQNDIVWEVAIADRLAAIRQKYDPHNIFRAPFFQLQTISQEAEISDKDAAEERSAKRARTCRPKGPLTQQPQPDVGEASPDEKRETPAVRRNR